MTGAIVVGLMTHRDPPQIRRLVDRLRDDDRVQIVVHHDPRGPELSLPLEGVHLVPDPRPASWGSMGVAMAQFRTMAHALQVVEDLSWFLLISGADYPSRPISRVADSLEWSERDAFVRWFRADGDPEADVHPWQATTRRRYLHRLRIPGSHRSVPFPRRHPFGADSGLYVGDLWVNLRRGACEHVLEQFRRRQDLVRYFSRCSIPDEALLPTLLLNGDHCLDVDTDHRRYIRWQPGSPHPRLLEPEDVPEIASSTSFFARKVDRQSNEDVMALLDAVE